MRNYWLDRRPKIYCQSNPYVEHFGKFYVIKGDSSDTFRYLHNDGCWRISAWNPQTGEYTGYYNSEAEAQRQIDIWASNP